MASDLLEQAWIAKSTGDHNRAIDLFGQVVHADPLNAEAHRELGLLYYGVKKDNLEAARLLQVSLSLQNSADTHYFLALVMERLKSVNEARSEFLVALRLYQDQPNDPLHALARSHYGAFLANLGLFDEAKKYMMEASLLYPESESIRRDLLRLEKRIYNEG